MKTKFVIPLTIVFSLLFIAPCFADDFSFIKYPDGTAELQNYYGKDIDVDGTQSTYTYSPTGNNVTIPIYLFARNVNNVPTGLAELKMYYFKAYDEYGNIALDLIPCYRKSDNEIGMYDTVNQTFLTNQGTGTFVKGGDV